MKFKTILLVISLIIFNSCKTENTEGKIVKSETENSKIEETLQEKIDNDKITVLEETKNDSLKKVVVNLELSEKVGEKELKKIAKKIRKHEDDEKYEKIWIFYFLKGTKENSGAWATTHYSPDLEIKILGATSEEEVDSKNKVNSIKGKIIGKWYEEQYTTSSIVLYEDNGKIYCKTIFKNGQEMIENLETAKVDLGTKYYDKENSVGEYYVLLRNGDLGFFNKENKQYTTGKIIK